MTEQMAERSSEQVELVRRAKAVIPGGTTNSITPPSGLEFVVERGEGAYLVDVDGRRFLDFLIGGGPLILGHAHPRMVEVLKASVVRGTHHFELTDRTVELAERLVATIPSAEQVRFTSSGSEATFHALRLARAVTGRGAFVKFDGAYHGHHDQAAWSYEDAPVGATGPVPGSGGIQAGVELDVVVLPYNDAEAVREFFATTDNPPAAVIVEPYQRALKPAPGFLESLRDECTRAGTVLIFDEVVTGFRTMPGGAQERLGVTPDLTALGKAMSGGLPLSALVGKTDLMAHLDEVDGPAPHSFHCGTFNGYLHAVEAAHTTLDLMVDEGGWKRIEELTVATQDMLVRTFRDLGVPVFVTGGIGLFHAYFTDGVVTNADEVRRSDQALNRALHLKLREAGIYKSNPKGYVSLAHDDSHIEALSQAIRWAYSNLV